MGGNHLVLCVVTIRVLCYDHQIMTCFFYTNTLWHDCGLLIMLGKGHLNEFKNILSNLYIRHTSMCYDGKYIFVHNFRTKHLGWWYWCLGLFLWSRNSMVPFSLTDNLDLSRLWPLQCNGETWLLDWGCLWSDVHETSFFFFFWNDNLSCFWWINLKLGGWIHYIKTDVRIDFWGNWTVKFQMAAVLQVFIIQISTFCACMFACVQVMPRTGGYDPEPVWITFHHQGSTIINAYNQVATNLFFQDWGKYGGNHLVHHCN